MPHSIALLRAINLAGKRAVSMAELRTMLEALGMQDVRSLLQSGNLVFRGSGSSSALERRFEKAAAVRFGFEIDFFVRTAAEWKAIVAANPFPKEAKADPGHLLVVVLDQAPARGAEAELKRAIQGREVARIVGREAYIVYPDGVGRSKLTSALIEKKLGARGTARNWNTVVKLLAKAASN